LIDREAAAAGFIAEENSSIKSFQLTINYSRIPLKNLKEARSLSKIGYFEEIKFHKLS
jgi:hypothetical protein